MELYSLPKLKGKRRPAKRVGRGYGSGKGGHTSGRGQKGQKSRSKPNVGFEGGQLPLYRRLPRYRGRGSGRPSRPETAVLNLDRLVELPDGTVVSPKTLGQKGIIDKDYRGGVKILGRGEIKSKLTVEGIKLSRGAERKIIAASGKVG